MKIGMRGIPVNNRPYISRSSLEETLTRFMNFPSNYNGLDIYEFPKDMFTYLNEDDIYSELYLNEDLIDRLALNFEHNDITVGINIPNDIFGSRKGMNQLNTSMIMFENFKSCYIRMDLDVTEYELGDVIGISNGLSMLNEMYNVNIMGLLRLGFNYDKYSSSFIKYLYDNFRITPILVINEDTNMNRVISLFNQILDEYIVEFEMDDDSDLSGLSMLVKEFPDISVIINSNSREFAVNSVMKSLRKEGVMI